MNERPDHPAQTIWQCQPLEGSNMSADAIRLRATKFERKISRRNLRETIAGLFVISFFAYFFATTHEVVLRTTWGLFIAGMVWVLVNLRLKAAPRSMPAAMGTSSCLEFFRSELERQRDALKNVWPWYLAPLVPGYLALNVAYMLASRHRSWTVLILLDVFFVALFVGVWKLNQRAARCLERTIDELNENQG